MAAVRIEGRPGMDAVSAIALPRLDRSRLAAAQVFELLRERIISLELSPGTVLSRAALAEEFRLSSTPIRDALMKLEEEKLVEVFPQHATIVSPIDLTLARQAQFLRRSVCCTDQGCGRNDPFPVLGSCDADGLRASQLQHAVQDLDGDVPLGRPTLVRTRAQPVPDHALEPADGGLGPGPFRVSGRPL